MTEEERFRKLIFKQQFLEALSKRLNIEESTLKIKFYTKLSNKHRNRIKDALNKWEAYEEEVKEMRVNLLEKI